MSSPVVCAFLFRWILPLVLLGACCFRFNGFSVIYLCCLLAVPLLPNPSRGPTGNFQKTLLGLSVFALMAQIAFQIVLAALPPYGHFFPNCKYKGNCVSSLCFFQSLNPEYHNISSRYEQLTRQIGLSRLFGLVGIIYTDCSAPLALHVRPYLDWPQCASPGVILALYWLLATETRYYFIHDNGSRYERQTHWWDPRTWPQTYSAERQSLMVGGQTNYNTLGPVPESIVTEEPVQPIQEPYEYPGVQGTLGSIMMFLMRQSYIAALIIMMAWSITYHSWLTFVLLLWACLIWITPFARWFCMVSSPGLVIYAELLLLVQYVYGLQLTDDELPLQDPTGTFDYSELGLKKWKFPYSLYLGFLGDIETAYQREENEKKGERK
ncbi:hypothetical protein pdam_00022789 [Pocillopora damicornis]|uniref:Piezo TM1-24 domain-containing protein n=1 Tax=Pocillopora damicornis TaxID=46731 RepID=A0A3M6UV11_POCDA|nr:hypothetical protein pdam_00022789 [Pocillopora damicornis]